MELLPANPETNLLPSDGSVCYVCPFLSKAEADGYFAALMKEVPWQHDEVNMFGKRIVTARRVAWYGDADFAYTYSGVTRHALPWNELLLELRMRVQQRCEASFNSCLLNLYANGNEGMGWHSDDEKTLAPHGAIASVSLGAERRFCFKHKRTAQLAEVVLKHGSLLVMKDETQSHWWHSLPKAKRILQPRINLTFRTMLKQR